MVTSNPDVMLLLAYTVQVVQFCVWGWILVSAGPDKLVDERRGI